MHVDGSAGTGKSYLIHTVSAHLAERAHSDDKRDPLVRAAPTGIAARNISGRTLHSLLRLPLRSRFLTTMHNGILAHLQGHWRERAYLIIDEKSMVGLKELYWIDSRLRTIMSKPELEFGGLNVILFGDFYQLPPVCSKPMYDSGVVSDPEMTCGQLLYSRFDKAVVSCARVVTMSEAAGLGTPWQKFGITAPMVSQTVPCSFCGRG
jgi:PIF1-like helicase